MTLKKGRYEVDLLCVGLICPNTVAVINKINMPACRHALTIHCGTLVLWKYIYIRVTCRLKLYHFEAFLSSSIRVKSIPRFKFDLIMFQEFLYVLS